MKDLILKIIQSDSKESSKRVMAIWTMMIITVVSLVICWKNPTERIVLITTLIAFVVTLMGIGAIEKRKSYKQDLEKVVKKDDI